MVGIINKIQLITTFFIKFSWSLELSEFFAHSFQALAQAWLHSVINKIISQLHTLNLFDI